MAWTTKNSLNRWCLRTLQEGTQSPLHNHLHTKLGLALLAHPRCKGRPPLQNACIAPHCDKWVAIDGEQGYCEARRALVKK